MTLREVNDTSNALAVMTVLASILPAGTQLAAGIAASGGQVSDVVYIQNRYKLSLGAFPALHMAEGPQSRNRNSLHTYLGQTTIRATYYDRWDVQVLTQDQIRANMALDLNRMLSNLESDDEVEYNGAIKTISLANYTLSPYDGEFESTLIPGATLIYRYSDMTFNVLPYVV